MQPLRKEPIGFRDAHAPGVLGDAHLVEPAILRGAGPGEERVEVSGADVMAQRDPLRIAAVEESEHAVGNAERREEDRALPRCGRATAQPCGSNGHFPRPYDLGKPTLVLDWQPL